MAELPFEARAQLLRAAISRRPCARVSTQPACLDRQTRINTRSSCRELVDFFRLSSSAQDARRTALRLRSWNRSDRRPLEGFSTQVAFQLPIHRCQHSLRALLAATCRCGSPDDKLFGCWQLLESCARRLPEGVMQYSGRGDSSQVILQSPHLAGIHFTGSLAPSARSGKPSERTCQLPRLPALDW